MNVSSQKREADAYLLANGPVDRNELIAWIMPRLSYGQWQSGLRHRKHGADSPHASRRKDDWEVGARYYARQMVGNAVRTGTWVRGENDMVRHREWVSGATFSVPTRDQLDGLSRLLLASDWEKAAIVAAFVEEAEKPGPQSSTRTSRTLTPGEFAALGIVGLKSKDTVRKYVRAWMQHVGTRPTPGEPVALPRIPFPALRERSDDAPATTEPTPAAPPQPKPQHHPTARIDNAGSLAKGLRDHYGDDRAVEVARDTLAETERQRSQARANNRKRKRTRNGAQVIQMRRTS